MALIQISSVAAETVKEDQLQIVARWKSTDKRVIPAANKERAIVLPASIWSGEFSVSMTTMNQDAAKSLKLLMLDAVETLARSYLSTIVEDSNWMRTEVNEDAFTLNSLLTWNAEQSAISGRLTGDIVKEWLKTSITIKTITEKHGKEIADALGKQFISLASPNHGLTAEKAGKLLANLWQADDADSNTGLRVQLRLQAIRDKAANSTANVLDSIL